MKHFFLVHSTITYLIARQLIETEAINKANCLFLTDRGYTCTDKTIASEDISTLVLYDIKGKDWRLLSQQWRTNRRHIKQLDALIAARLKTSTSFLLYLPHSQTFSFLALLSHPQCTGLFYFEEGRMSYTWEEHLFSALPEAKQKAVRFKKRLLNPIHYFYLKNRVPAFPEVFDLQHPKYRGAYTLSEWSLAGFPNRKILPLPFEKSKEWQDVQEVIIFGPHVEYGEIDMSTLKKVLPQLLAHLIKLGKKKVYIKFHPAQYKREVSLPVILGIMKSYEVQLPFEILKPEVSLENIAISAQGNFYTAVSSAGLYAIICGAKVFSFARAYLEQFPAFEQVMRTVPKVYEEQLEFIDLNGDQ